MLKRFLNAFRSTPKIVPTAQNTPPFADIYELLFCDRPQLFAPKGLEDAAYWQKALYALEDPSNVQTIANDQNEESRIRLLAYRWLSAHSRHIDSKEILGVVIEVGLENGNDVLAAYSDGTVRYINQAGKLAIFEGGSAEVSNAAKKLVSASRNTVDKIGPWDQPRRPPPSRGDIRLTFLVADGLYFGEGPFNLLANEPMAKPVIQAGLELLQLCVSAATAKA